MKTRTFLDKKGEVVKGDSPSAATCIETEYDKNENLVSETIYFVKGKKE